MFGIPWHRLPTPLALLKLVGFRNKLRQENLHDTAQLPDTNKLPHPQASPDGRHLVARTPDGSFNDLKNPTMGMVETRLGRNVPLTKANVDQKNILNPNPRVVSQRLMTRDEFIPATSLNILAAAWIQFQNHDWFSHGNNQPDKKIVIPLAEDDTWPQEHRPMAIKETLVDQSRPEGDKAEPPTFINKVTHWWDGSQIYGNNATQVHELRSHVDGKLIIGDDGLLPVDPAIGIDRTGFNDNWWIGLSLMHTLFVKEHNTICDRLKQQYPDWRDDDLYDHARLINAALMAKIHTVEWTPGILAHPALQIAMSANWWGLLGQHVKNLWGRVGEGETLSGIIGSPTDHHAAPYYITEEFVSVYRLHPLIPDEFEFYSHKNGQLRRTGDFFEVAGKRARGVVEEIGIPDLFYSLGIAHPGAITLHNYPKALQKLIRDNGETLDLAAIDILRDRERGVPRYNEFREIIGRGRVKSFEEITSKPVWAKELREVYNNDINSVDLVVGMFAEDLPDGFGFSDTAFRVFILMASRRLKSDRFFTKDYRAEIYTQFGLDWIDSNGLLSVLRRHYPTLAPALFGINNGFAPWRKVGIAGY
ncbi:MULTISPECIES: peroxidase family protein [unclassified Tolypothrix]|uniref:peroxidase family protein n=1 Tax=unclassified Tolypothrix TaxID=2649714 RepID=UPI0005EAADCA|nr:MULTISPECIES: peroxidase family protein [unclassified Tolypothrix]BAY92804.1 putative peroxidase family protein [Microchaete diplosiphon NIES-3275]EKF04151.1 animal heme peroxidase [Tolypothrix sp. PCC 7601]MBE9087717.1 peroxidase [Tolypothrix sp. LEGE 11397]UYD26722.1 peroxidase [Tolypothrix sp. PCC 7712]UYD37417.1 peroxidase [Tolypothrix sp. PCC 7601]